MKFKVGDKVITDKNKQGVVVDFVFDCKNYWIKIKNEPELWREEGLRLAEDNSTYTEDLLPCKKCKEFPNMWKHDLKPDCYKISCRCSSSLVFSTKLSGVVEWNKYYGEKIKRELKRGDVVYIRGIVWDTERDEFGNIRCFTPYNNKTAKKRYEEQFSYNVFVYSDPVILEEVFTLEELQDMNHDSE